MVSLFMNTSMVLPLELGGQPIIRTSSEVHQDIQSTPLKEIPLWIGLPKEQVDLLATK